MYCTVCWSEFNSEITAQTHYESNSHLECAKFQREYKENRLLGEFYCQICSLYANSLNSLAVHLGSKTHRNKIASRERIQALEEKKNQLCKTQQLELTSRQINGLPTTNIVQIKPSTTSKLNNYCEVCSLQLDSTIAYAVHLGSSNHKAKFKNVNVPMSLKRSPTFNRNGFGGDVSPIKYNFTREESSHRDLAPHSKDFFCNICLIIFKSEDILAHHFLSEKHKKKVEVLEMINKIKENGRDTSSSDSRMSDSSSDLNVEKSFNRAHSKRNLNNFNDNQNFSNRNFFIDDYYRENNNKYISHEYQKRTNSYNQNWYKTGNDSKEIRPNKANKVLTQIENNKSAHVNYLPTTPIKNSNIPNSDYWFDNENPPPSQSQSQPLTEDHNLLNLLNKINIQSLSNSADWCHCCYLKYTSESEKKKHLEGREHQRRVETKEKLSRNLVDSTEYCEYCFMKLQDGVQRNAHLRSNSHQIQIKRRIEYLKYIKNHAFNVSSPGVDVAKTSLKSCKTYMNMFPISETEATETFNELDVKIEIFQKANVKIYKYSNRNQLYDENDKNKSKKGPKLFKSIEDALRALSESSLDSDSTSFSEKQSDNDNSDAFSSLNLEEVNEAIKEDKDNIDKFIRENFDLFDKSLNIVFDSIAKISSAGNN